MAEVSVGTGLAPADLMLDLGDLHPSGHGAFRLGCRIEGDRIVSADPRPGLLHRGTEKLLEARDYRQALMLANRHDWLEAVVSEVTLAQAVEELLGLQVPPRATWLRTLLCEINRASAALLLLAGAATLPPRGLPAADAPGIRAREAWLNALETISGGRVHTMMARIGGVAHDAPPGFADLVLRAVEETRAAVPSALDEMSRTIPGDVATLDRTTAERWGVGGPVARASGIDADLRRDHPCLAYADLADDLAIVTSSDGDARARYDVLGRQVLADLAVIERCLERLPEGPVDVRLPKVVRAPEGSAYAWMESAIGVTGAYVVSTGGTTPWRVRLRTASYANVQAMGEALPGTALEDLPAAVGSFMFVAGDLDH